MKHSLSDISIIIVTYKGDGLLKDCLDSLAMACGTEPQIVVVDNSPSDATRKAVSAFSNAVYVPSPGNPGFAGGNNRALAHCDRPYILLLNNDTVIHSRTSIERLVEFLDGHPACGVAQGSMVLPQSGGLLGGCGSFLTPFGFLYSPGFGVPDAPEFHAPYPCFSDIGAFMAFRRALLPAVGGMLFRTHFWSYYEETDFCHRVWLSGSEVWYVPTPPIDHLCGQTSGRFVRAEIMGGFLRNQYFSLAANLSALSRLFVLPCLTCVILGHGLLHLLRGDTPQFKANLKALKSILHDRRRILAARRQAARIRRVSDFAIFRKVMRVPSLRYFLRSIRAHG